MGDAGQVTRSAAGIYDELFLPALFNEWAPRVAELAEVKPGMRVLDVACGTGVLSLVAANIVGPDGSVVGVPDIKITTLDGNARFPSIRYWMEADIRGWTLADVLDDAQFELLVSEAETELERFVTNDGTVEFDNPAHIVTAIKRAG